MLFHVALVDVLGKGQGSSSETTGSRRVFLLLLFEFPALILVWILFLFCCCCCWPLWNLLRRRIPFTLFFCVLSLSLSLSLSLYTRFVREPNIPCTPKWEKENTVDARPRPSFAALLNPVKPSTAQFTPLKPSTTQYNPIKHSKTQ